MRFPSRLLRPAGVGALALALAAMGLASCKSKPSQAEVNAEREQKQLSRELKKLRKEVIMLRQSIKGEAAVDISHWNKTSATPEAEMELLQREVFDLAREMDPKKERATEATEMVFFWGSGTNQVSEVTIPPGYVSWGYRLANSGTATVVDPKIRPEGTMPISSAADILQGIWQGKTGDQDKAIALWNFVRHAREHYYPSQQGGETEDPVKLANIYGYGYCDDAATALAWLATAGGYQARVWDLDGHVVPEVFYEGSWHMLDPDEEVYYLDGQGKIASVEWLTTHPETISSLQGGKPPITARLADIYRTTENNHLVRVDKEIQGAIHEISYSLRPGESIVLSSEPSGKFFSSQYYWSHPPHGTGQWLFEPDLTTDLFQQGAAKVENLQAGLKLKQADREGILAYEFSPSYPMLDGEVQGEAQLAKDAEFFVEFSQDGQEWKTVQEVRGPLNGLWAASLESCFPNGYGSPLYRGFLRLRIPAGKAGAVEITKCEISLDLKVAPKAVFALKEGRQKVLYTSKGAAGSTTDVNILIKPTP